MEMGATENQLDFIFCKLLAVGHFVKSHHILVTIILQK